jgi:hypothetical protein
MYSIVMLVVIAFLNKAKKKIEKKAAVKLAVNLNALIFMVYFYYIKVNLSADLESQIIKNALSLKLF